MTLSPFVPNQSNQTTLLLRRQQQQDYRKQHPDSFRNYHFPTTIMAPADEYSDEEEEEEDDEEDEEQDDEEDDEDDEDEDDEEEEEEEVEPAPKPVRKRKNKSGKDPNKPKRNMSAFFIYSGANRSRVKEENPGIAFGQIVSENGETKVATSSIAGFCVSFHFVSRRVDGGIM